MSFDAILEKYRSASFHERDKGDKFEGLMQAYLRTDPKYAIQFKSVYLWNDFPGRADLGGIDSGIDLVAVTHDDHYWAVQCKCYAEGTRIDKPAVDGFLATSSKTFEGEDLRRVSFSHRLWISTTSNWGKNAKEAIKGQHPAVSRITQWDLRESPVDWAKLEEGVHGEPARRERFSLRPHQVEAVAKTHEHFKTQDRGKLIMACGTGKTFTALRVAERETGGEGLVLFLVPSIALLGQSLNGWAADALQPIHAICICSDPKSSKVKGASDDDSTGIVDLPLPASTDPNRILEQFREIATREKKGLTVVFSTYQSIDVVAKAQEVWMADGFPEFDLIVCDEAHRTTGVALEGEDQSVFTKVHWNENVKAKKRLYMTATPRLFSDDSKNKADQNDAVLCSMDDVSFYGEEIYRIGFGQAVEEGLLTDYKVIVLTLSEEDVPLAVQKMISNDENEVTADDASKLIGCINALSKQFVGISDDVVQRDPLPMRRAVAFCSSIKASKQITATYNTAARTYVDELPTAVRPKMVSVEAQHMDGTMNAPHREELLHWLKEDTEDNACRILTNVRVLSEGVDVPSLDAVMFLSARNSQVDVVQSVGRVMRLSPGKEYGYIIIPVIVPANVEPEAALNDNKRFAVVWTVLNALRAHDDRFNALVNKIELNKRKPDKINVGAPAVGFDNDGNPVQRRTKSNEDAERQVLANQMALQFGDLQDVVYAKLVKKVGDRLYWEQWAKDIAAIAQRQIARITSIVNSNEADNRAAFDGFLKSLRQNLNPGISESQAIEMLGQHIITKPVFEALFEGYSFVKSNVVSIAMQELLDYLNAETSLEDHAKLERFYKSVRDRASGITDAEAKQKIIVELYDKFFSTAFPRMVEQLGIVYTPIEVVDYIIHSVNDLLKQEFGRSLSDENVHILDPFTGTGTFITRLIQSGLIEQKDLARKFQHELHANEIVLLAYYIAAVNIENAYHDQLAEDAAYESFPGIVLTDTFQLGESDGSDQLFKDSFRQNSSRVERQRKAPLKVILGNPPYSVGQKSANDNAQNQSYPKLEARIAGTYVKESTAGLSKSMYDAYIKAFRWASDRLGAETGGIIGFVTNGAWLDSNGADGFRQTVESEFTSIYVFNLRGNQRTSGEMSRKEGGKIFGSGSRTPVSITLLVKNPKDGRQKATIYYRDIGDYLSQKDKLSLVRKYGSIDAERMAWRTLEPNEDGVWIKQGAEGFEEMIPIEPGRKFKENKSIFTAYSLGLSSNRDAWVYNFSASKLTTNNNDSIVYFNALSSSEKQAKGQSEVPSINAKRFSWSASIGRIWQANRLLSFEVDSVNIATYRPFTKLKLYHGSNLIERRGQQFIFFPTPTSQNYLICVSGISGTKPFSALMTDKLSDLHVNGDAQCFPLYYYEDAQLSNTNLFDGQVQQGYTRREGISDFILGEARKAYGKGISKEDIFYYVYGFLHSPTYREMFANDLRRSLPRLPLVESSKDFWAFSKAGQRLAELHVDYEQVSPMPGVVVEGAESGKFRVEKMRFGKGKDKRIIHYNENITVSGIPERAYEYVVNGRSAVEWIIDRYQVRTDKKSGIINDPNDWAKEVGNPRYILDLLLSVINVSVQTVGVVAGLPGLSFTKT